MMHGCYIDTHSVRKKHCSKVNSPLLKISIKTQKFEIEKKNIEIGRGYSSNESWEFP